MAKLRFYTCCLLFFLLVTGMGLVAAVFILFWYQGITGNLNLDLLQVSALVRVLRMVGFYILITAILFTFIGYFFLARKLLHPIDSLISQADDFSGKQEDLLFSDQPGEGFNRLSRSLNNLIQRLARDQAQLKVTVEALEKANADLQATQQEMIRTEKLVSIGRLTAGLAHEIGNPLGILSGYLELLQKRDITTTQAQDFLARAGKEVGRIDTLLSRLLEFARPSAGDVRACSIHQLIRECFDDLHYQPLFKDIEFQLTLDAVHDQVMADPVQVRQVLLNCAVNGADAIHEQGSGGVITVSTRTLVAGDGDGDSTLVLTLQDTGGGVASEHLSSLFDPFFTTKDAGKGTGLGLSVCYMIIKEMGGTIEVANDEGRGALVTIKLPCVESA